MAKCKVCGTKIPKGFPSCPKCGCPAKPSVISGKPSFTEDDVKWLAKLIEEKGDIGVRMNERGELEPYVEIVTEDKEEAERAARLMKEMSDEGLREMGISPEDERAGDVTFDYIDEYGRVRRLWRHPPSRRCSTTVGG